MPAKGRGPRRSSRPVLEGPRFRSSVFHVKRHLEIGGRPTSFVG
jgi:hypothetical protein